MDTNKSTNLPAGINLKKYLAIAASTLLFINLFANYVG